MPTDTPPKAIPDEFAAFTLRTAKLLVGEGLTTAQQVVDRYPEDLLNIKGFGCKSLREVERCFLPGKHYAPRSANH